MTWFFNKIKQNRIRVRSGCILLLFLTGYLRSYSQEHPPSPTGQAPTLPGNWTYNVPGADITEAGNNFTGTYESAANQMIFNRNSPGIYYPNWSITVNKSDVLWNANIKLWIRRTGNGTSVSGATISNGAGYQEIVNTPTSFFSGYKEVNEVPLQLKFTGISVVVPVNTYSTILTFTVTEY